jgi:hypothetical protein
MGTGRLVLPPRAPSICSAFLLAISLAALPALARSDSVPDWLAAALRAAPPVEAESESAAVILVHTEVMEISDDGRAQSHVRFAARILRAAGERFGRLDEEISPRREIKKLKGWRVSSAGVVQPLDRDDIVEMEEPAVATFYDDDRYLCAVLPGAERGDVVAFEYDVESEAWASALTVFTFQERVPVLLARFTLTIPAGWTLLQSGWRLEPVVHESTANAYAWTARDLEAEPDEPLLPPGYEIGRWLLVGVYAASGPEPFRFGDWPQVSAWVGQTHDDAALPVDTITAEARALCANLTTPAEKAMAISRFVQDGIRYVGVEIGEGRWVPRPAALTLRQRYGDCKDKTALMRALLAAVEIPSAAVLASTGHGVLAETPSPWQFNHCIVGIPRDSGPGFPPWPEATAGGWIFFDPTDPAAPFGELPEALWGKDVLPGRAGGALTTLPPPAADGGRRRYWAAVALDSAGSLNGAARITDFGRQAARIRAYRSKVGETAQLRSWQERLTATIPAAAITDFQSGADADSAWVSFHLEARHYVSAAATLAVCKLDFFAPEAPPELEAATRRHPIWFRAPLTVETEVTWSLPDWEFESEPEPVAAVGPPGRVASSFDATGHEASFRTLIEYSGRILPPADYEDARRFDAEVSALKSAGIVLRRRGGER